MTDEGALVRITGPSLSATINPLGAELQGLQDEAGRDLLWNGDPAWWTGRAPVLFPIVGAVAGDVIRIAGRTYPMAKHGFARRRVFAVVERTDDAVTFRLQADDATRAHYPFDFGLDVRFAIAGTVLSVDAELHNPGPAPLPASFGFHPALRWPLPYGGARADHCVRFEQDEPAPIRRIGADQLLRDQPEPTPVVGGLLAVRDSLFDEDALIFDRLRSRSVTFGAPGTRAVRVNFADMPLLGIWTKPGAPYLCIEPWQGVADPTGFAGEFADKPGVIQIAPGAFARFGMRIDSDAGTF